MSTPEFVIRARKGSHGALIEIAPQLSALSNAYVGVPVAAVAALRPAVAIADAGQPPPDDSVYSSVCEIAGETTPMALFLTNADIAVGRAVYLRCSAVPQRFVFGSRGGARYTADAGIDHTQEPELLSLDEWLQRYPPRSGAV